MAQKNIDFGTFPDDPAADAIRTAFEKVQDNFTDLYQVSRSTGVNSIIAGNGLKERNNRSQGDIILDSLLPNVTIQTGTSLVTGVNQVVSGNTSTISASTSSFWLDIGDTVTTNNATLSNNVTTKNLIISGNVTGNLLPNGTLNLGSSSQKWNNTFANNSTVTANISAGNITVGNVVVANYFTGILTTPAQPNITSTGTLVNVTVTGNATAGNLITGGIVSATGNVSGSNVIVSGTTDANTSIGGSAKGAVVVSGGAHITKNLNVGNGIITGNVLTSNLSTNYLGISGNIEWNVGTKIFTENYNSSIEIYSTGAGWSELNYANTQLAWVESTGVYIEANATGTSKLWSFNKSGSFTAPGDISGSNLTSSGNVTVSGRVSATGNVSGANIIASANITGVNITATGNVSGANLNTTGNITVVAVNASGNVSGSNLNATGNVVATGNISGANITGTGNLSALNISTANVTATGNISGVNIAATGNISGVINITASGNIAAGNISLTGNSTITGNASIGNISTGRITATGNVSGANINASANIIATGDISGSNITASGNITASKITITGNISGGNITTSGDLAVTGYANVGIINGTSLSISGNVSGNVFVGSLFTGNGATLSNIAGPNVDGIVPLANFASFAGSANASSRAITVTANAQPNITSVGLLSNVTVSGSVSTANLISSSFVVQSVEMAITAAGTVQSTAKQLTKQINMITNAVASSYEGVQLPPAITGLIITIMNQTNATVKVYPSTGQNIEALSTDVPYNLTSTSRKQFIALSNTNWYTL